MATRVQPDNPFTAFPVVTQSETIVRRFEQQVEHCPQRIAIKTTTNAITYFELNAAVNKLAHTLLSASHADFNPVPILVSSREKRIIALLAVLKAGKTWVPLDPEHPGDRLNIILTDIHARFGIVDADSSAVSESLASEALQWLNMDDVPDGQPSSANPDLSIECDDIANILYTSGSTGQPKGVMHSHNNVLNFVRTHTNSMHISEHDRILMLSSYVHMAGLTAIFRALLNGATLYPFDLKREGLARLVLWMEEECVTTYQSVPSVFRYFVRSLNSKGRLPCLRLIHLAGERLTSQDVALYKKWFLSPCLLLNNLGATEVSTYRSFFIDHATEIADDVVPAGYSLEDKEVLLLGPDGQVLDEQGVGEIAVRSANMTIGYWHNEKETARVFMPDPDGGAERIYRTGDLGFIRADGCLEYHGRKDDQIKIRGLRVEPGEIEKVLLNHHDVSDSAVVAVSGPGMETRLFAYIVAKPMDEDELTQLRKYLFTRLPDYMVPSKIIRLDEMPVTFTGKLDRRELQQRSVDSGWRNPPGRVTGLSDKESCAKTGLERHLVKIWEQLLDYESIGVCDDFFTLGGSSLLAVHMLDEVERKFGKRLPMDTLWFGEATISRLARVLELDEQSYRWPALVPIKPGGDQVPLFCVHTKGGNLFHYDELAAALPDYVPVYGLQAQGIYGSEKLHHTIEGIASHCIKTMRKYRPEGPYHIVGYSSAGVVAYEMTQQLSVSGVDSVHLILVDAFPSKVRRYGHNWTRLKQVVFQKNFRYLQERMLHALLYPLRLGAFRKFGHAGEAHRWAHWSYQIKAYQGSATLLFTKESQQQTRGDTLGWASLISDLHVDSIDGSHGTLVKQPCVLELARQIHASLYSDNV